MKNTLSISNAIFRFERKLIKSQTIIFIGPVPSPQEYSRILKELEYYCPGAQLTKFPIIPGIIFPFPLLFYEGNLKIFRHFRDDIHNINPYLNPVDGWEWCRLAKEYQNNKSDIKRSKEIFLRVVSELKKRNLQRCYIFGTGPSLQQALNRDWSDGYRIVCNTIVKDKELWNHINPDIIVAGDAIYHFGSDSHAKIFRKDLHERLQETETYFIYPDSFDVIVKREFGDLSDRLIAIPPGDKTYFHYNLIDNFELPAIGNVLNLLLLPLACSLSKNVYLWGFDGRAPADTLFWGNSDKHSYPELIEDLRQRHPAFFNHFAPESDPNKYVRDVHGDALIERFKFAEMNGFTFYMMHKSYTPALMDKYLE